MTELVLRQDSHGAATLTLNRPEKLNALTKQVFEALEKHIDAITRETKTVGVVIIRGAGGNFSGGYDMSEIRSYVRARAKPHYESEIIDKLAGLPQPVISAVRGHCSTGALELALAGDGIIASASAQFSDAYARWGLTPVWGLSLRLPHRVGTAKASEMMFTCRSYTGAEAYEMHLVNQCFSDDEFEAGLGKLVKEILANSWYSNRVNKQALMQSHGLTLRDAYELDIFKDEGLAPDAAERVGRFFRKDSRSA